MLIHSLKLVAYIPERESEKMQSRNSFRKVILKIHEYSEINRTCRLTGVASPCEYIHLSMYVT